MRSFVFCCILSPVLAFAAAQKTSMSLDAKFDKAGTVNGVPVVGNFLDGGWAFGQDTLRLPAGNLLGDCGTVLTTFRILPGLRDAGHLRYITMLRTYSRVYAAIYADSGDKPLLRFSIADHDKHFRYVHKSRLESGRDYQAAFTYDGKIFRCYLDGRLLAEGVQPLPVVKPYYLSLGPYKDEWYSVEHGANSTVAKALRVWNRALTPSEIAAECGVKLTPLAESRKPCLSVPPLSVTPPIVDGELGDEAWKRAASLPSLINGNFKEQTGELPPHQFLVTYDAKALYLGFTSIFPGRAPIIAGNSREGDADVEPWGTESFEFYIFIDGIRYRFGGNVAGGSAEMRAMDSSWHGNWNYRTTLKMRIDDTMLWQGECAIPWETLGLKDPPASAGFDFCRTWKIPGVQTITSLNLTGCGYGNPEALVPLVFDPAAPTMRFTPSVNPNLGRLSGTLSVYSPVKDTVRFTVEIAPMDGSSSPVAIYNEAFPLESGDVAERKIDVPIPFTSSDAIVYGLYGKSNSVEVVPFKLQEDYFALTCLFLHEELRVKARMQMLKGKFGDGFAGKLVLSGPDGVLSEVPLKSEQTSFAFPRTSKAGRYKMTLVGADGKAIYEKTAEYPGRGEWESMKFDPSVIIPPYTPLKCTAVDGGFGAGMWGRTYTWRDSLLPVSVTSQGTQLFAKPMALLLNGREVAAASFTVENAAPHHTDYTAKAVSDVAELSLKGWVEYDGISWNTLSVIPKGDTESLKLRMSFPAALTKYIHAAAASSSWGAKLTASIAPGERMLQYYPMVWLGMEEKGFCFFVESRNGWNAPPKQTYRLVKGDTETTLEVNVATKLPVGKPFTMQFGFIATPFRPMATNYPLDTLSWSYISPLNRPGKTPASDVVYLSLPPNSGNLDTFFGDIPTADGRKRAEAMDAELKRIAPFCSRPIPYTMARYLSAEYPEMRAFKAEWDFQPEIALDYDNNGHYVYDCCPASRASAFFAWKFKQMLKRFPALKGIYFDFGLVSPCSNTLHGCDNRMPFLAQREFYRRIALVQLQAGIKEPVIVLHNTDCNQIPAFTFATHLLNGEHVRQASSTLLHDGKDILDTYGLEMFACELSTLPYGITNSVYMPFDYLLPKYGGGKEEPDMYRFRMTKASLAATLPHNTMQCIWRNHFGPFDKIVRLYSEFDVHNATFFGYWRQPARVIAGKDILVSVYTHNDGRALAVVSHIGHEHLSQELTIQFDLHKLGLNKITAVKDTMTADDPDYQLLTELQKKYNVPKVRGPLPLGNFGSILRSFTDNTVKLYLEYHSFAILLLNP